MSNITRRQFVQRAAALGVVSTVGFPRLIRAQGLNEKLQVGFVGAGGQAGSHTNASHAEGCQCIAFAETDKGRWGGVLGKEGWSKAAGYTDWRKVFEKHCIGVANNGRRRRLAEGKTAYHITRHGYHHRRRHALTGDIADGK